MEVMFNIKAKTDASCIPTMKKRQRQEANLRLGVWALSEGKQLLKMFKDIAEKLTGESDDEDDVEGQYNSVITVTADQDGVWGLTQEYEWTKKDVPQMFTPVSTPPSFNQFQLILPEEDSEPPWKKKRIE